MSARSVKNGGRCQLRTCLGCRRVRPQAELKRLALVSGSKGPKVIWDEERKLGGRGAWLCRGSSACLAAAVKKRFFCRAFKCADLEPPDLGSGEESFVVGQDAFKGS